MCKFLIAAMAAVLWVPVCASATEITSPTVSPVVNRGTAPVLARGDSDASWVAIAASTNGRVFQSGSFDSEESARSAARSECEHTSGRTCRDTMSVPNEWDVVVLRCGSQNFLGGSAQGVAYDNALAKAVAQGFTAGSCRRIASY
jgi:hypothetical protein